MVQGTIVDIQERMVKVLIADDGISTSFVPCLRTVPDSDLVIGNMAVLVLGTSYDDAVMIGVIG